MMRRKDFLVAKEAASMVMDIKTPAIVPTTNTSFNKTLETRVADMNDLTNCLSNKESTN